MGQGNGVEFAVQRRLEDGFCRGGLSEAYLSSFLSAACVRLNPASATERGQKSLARRNGSESSSVRLPTDEVGVRPKRPTRSLPVKPRHGAEVPWLWIR